MIPTNTHILDWIAKYGLTVFIAAAILLYAVHVVTGTIKDVAVASKVECDISTLDIGAIVTDGSDSWRVSGNYQYKSLGMWEINLSKDE